MTMPKPEVVTMYLHKGHKADEAEVLATGYEDAVDTIINVAHGLLRAFGPASVTLTSKAGNKVKLTAEAL